MDAPADREDGATALKIVRYRPAFVTGFERDDDVVDPWDEKLTADSNAHWFKQWIEGGSTLTLKRAEEGKYFKPTSGVPMLHHHVMGTYADGESWVCAIVYEPAPDDWRWL